MQYIVSGSDRKNKKRGSNSDSNSNGYTIKNTIANTNKNTDTVGNGNTSGTDGYGRGKGYSNRETAFHWSDGTTTYSNATDYRDAAEMAGKELSKTQLLSATTYGTGSLTDNSYNYGVTAVGDGSGRNGFTGNIYSRADSKGRGEELARAQAEYLSGLYGYDYGSAFGGNKNSGAYGRGSANALSESFSQTGYNPDSTYSAYNSTYNPTYNSAYSLNNAYGSGVDWLSEYSKAARKQAAAIQARTDAVINNLNAEREDYEEQLDEVARQAYITVKQAQLKLPQQLYAMGLNGGISETAALRLASEYENTLNENEKNRLSMNRDLNTQIANAQLSANSDISQMESEYYLNALQAYENQLERQQDYNMQLLSYELQRDKFDNDSYYDELNYSLSLDKQQRAAEEEEYERKLKRASVLADYGIFDGYRELGYTDSEINAMRAAYEAGQASVSASVRTVSGGTSSKTAKASKASGKSKTDTADSTTVKLRTPSLLDMIGAKPVASYVRAKYGLDF